MTDRMRQRDTAMWKGLFAVWGIALAAQIAFLFLLPAGSIPWLRYAGWGVFGLSALLGWIPILAFRLRGGVAKRRSYVHTTKLVTTGLYSIVRHPQYLAGDYIAVAVMCITQHWAAFLAGGVAILTNRLSMIKADKDLIGKFGDAYRTYMKHVPRASIAIGLWRRVRKRFTHRG